MDVWSILIIVGLVQGLFVLTLFFAKKEFQNKSQRYLMILVGIFIWLQLEFLSIRWPYTIDVTMFYGTRLGSWLAIGPVLFLYTKSLTTNKFEFGLKEALQFLPFVFFVLVLPLFYSDFLSFRQVHYGMLTAFDNFKQEVSPIQYVYSSVFIAQFIHLFVYLLLSLKTVNYYKQVLNKSYSSYSESEIAWLKVTIYFLIAILFFAALFLVRYFFNLEYRRHLDYIYVLPMSFLMYLVSYKLAGVQFTSLAEEEVVVETSKYKKSSLKPEQAEAYAESLQEFVEEKKPFLTNGLKLKDLSEQLDIPLNHLSQVINDKFGDSFYDFINKHRVLEAKQLMEKEKKATLLEIAYSSGFNNKTSFANAFKKFAGLSPSSYRKKLVEERVKN